MFDREASFFRTLNFLLSGAAIPRTKTLLNFDKDALALQGYDPVAFFTEGEPVKGAPEFQSSYRGVKYHFVSKENKAIFDQEPAKCEPQFGGYCAFGVSRGYLVTIAVEAFQVLNGRLLLHFDNGHPRQIQQGPHE